MAPEAEQDVGRESEGLRLRALLNGLLDAVLVVDPMGIITTASESVRRTFGYAPEELVGRNVSLLMPEPHRSNHDAYLARYRETGETWILNTTRQFDVLRKDGRLITCELSVSRIDVEVTGEVAFIGSFRDVTERVLAERRLAESERRFRAIFDQEYQFVGLLDPQGLVLEANRASLDAMGIELDDVAGRPFWETPWWAHSETERDRLRAAIKAAARGEFVRYETSHPSRGKLVAVDFSLKPIFDDEGNVTLLLPEGRDISALKEAQARETSMLRALAAIGESASVLAHEIKNPITAVNIALRAVADQLGQAHSAVLEDLVQRMQKLEQTMRRTLSFAGPLLLRRQPGDPRELAREALATLQPLADRTGCRLELDAPDDLPEVSVDAGVFEEVLVNLVRNSIEAIQESPPEGGGLVRIRLAAVGEGSGRGVEFLVEDDGPGVPPSMLPTLFKPFHSSKEEGTGLGMALAQKVVEEHGGVIELATTDLGGAAFRIVLSSAPAASPS